jgi:hypothetical protein
MGSATAMTMDDRRSYVRGDFAFKVKFRRINPEESENWRISNEEIFSQFTEKQNNEISTAGMHTEVLADPSLINYLLQMDDKLDQIIELLSKEKKIKGIFLKGLGTDISGSGMKILVDEAVEPGQFIQAKFLLSKYPLSFMDILGEVIHVIPVDEKEQTLYHLGVKFINLSTNERERIIACVFQKQREILRKRKTKILNTY